MNLKRDNIQFTKKISYLNQEYQFPHLRVYPPNQGLISTPTTREPWRDSHVQTITRSLFFMQTSILKSRFIRDKSKKSMTYYIWSPPNDKKDKYVIICCKPMSVSKGVKKLYKIIVDNNFAPLSPQELALISGYKNVNSIDQVLSRNSAYFTVQGGTGNRRVSIPSDKKSMAVFIRDNFHCVYCNQQVTMETATLDHIVPYSKGKQNDPSNLATSCVGCNRLKKDMSANSFIEDVLTKDRVMVARENIRRIAGQIPGKKRGKSTRKKDTPTPTSTILSDENKLKSIVRKVVQSEFNKKKKYEYTSVYLIERAGYWVCIEDGNEWTVDDDNGQPISTIPDILNVLAEEGWRCIQLLETAQYRGEAFSVGKQYLTILEKVQ